MIVCKLSGYTILQMFLTWQLPVKSGQSRALEWRTDKQSGGDQITADSVHGSTTQNAFMSAPDN